MEQRISTRFKLYQIFVKVLEKRRSGNMSKNVRQCVGLSLGLHVFICVIAICLGLGITNGLVYSVRTSMFVLQRNGDTKAASNWMDMYQVGS